jgi:hypothetical protein
MWHASHFPGQRAKAVGGLMVEKALRFSGCSGAPALEFDRLITNGDADARLAS